MGGAWPHLSEEQKMAVIVEVFEKILADTFWLLKTKNVGAILFVVLVLGLAAFYIFELIYLLSS